MVALARRRGDRRSWSRSEDGPRRLGTTVAKLAIAEDTTRLSLEPDDAIFRLEGEYWTIALPRTPRSASTTPRDSSYIHRLLAAPGQGGARPRPRGRRSVGPGRRHSTPDGDDLSVRRPRRTDSSTARREAYRARVEDLRDQIEEAEAHGDLERASRAREELDFITDELDRQHPRRRHLALGARRHRTGPREREPSDPRVDREDRRAGRVARSSPRSRHPDRDLLLLWSRSRRHARLAPLTSAIRVLAPRSAECSSDRAAGVNDVQPESNASPDDARRRIRWARKERRTMQPDTISAANDDATAPPVAERQPAVRPGRGVRWWPRRDGSSLASWAVALFSHRTQQRRAIERLERRCAARPTRAAVALTARVRRARLGPVVPSRPRSDGIFDPSVDRRRRAVFVFTLMAGPFQGSAFVISSGDHGPRCSSRTTTSCGSCGPTGVRRVVVRAGDASFNGTIVHGSPGRRPRGRRGGRARSPALESERSVARCR